MFYEDPLRKDLMPLSSLSFNPHIRLGYLTSAAAQAKSSFTAAHLD